MKRTLCLFIFSISNKRLNFAMPYQHLNLEFLKIMNFIQFIVSKLAKKKDWYKIKELRYRLVWKIIKSSRHVFLTDVNLSNRQLTSP